MIREALIRRLGGLTQTEVCELIHASGGLCRAAINKDKNLAMLYFKRVVSSIRQLDPQAAKTYGLQARPKIEARERIVRSVAKYIWGHEGAVRE